MEMDESTSYSRYFKWQRSLLSLPAVAFVVVILPTKRRAVSLQLKSEPTKMTSRGEARRRRLSRFTSCCHVALLLSSVTHVQSRWLLSPMSLLHTHSCSGPHRMHEMRPIATNIPMARCVCVTQSLTQSVCLSLTRLCPAKNGYTDRGPVWGEDSGTQVTLDESSDPPKTRGKESGEKCCQVPHTRREGGYLVRHSSNFNTCSLATCYASVSYKRKRQIFNRLVPSVCRSVYASWSAREEKA